MVQGVGNLHHYQSHALACNQLYLDALTPVNDPTPGYDDLKILTEPKREQGRSTAGFNPVREEDARLFAVVLAGDHIARGFLQQGHSHRIFAGVKDRKRRRRQSAADRPNLEPLACTEPGEKSASQPPLACHRPRPPHPGRHAAYVSPL